MKLSLTSDSLGECYVCATGAVSHTSHDFAEPLRRLVGTLSSQRIFLNMESATSIDSSGIRWLLLCRQEILQAGGELVLYAMPPCIAGPLRLLKLLPIFSTAQDLKTALSLPQRRDLK